MNRKRIPAIFLSILFGGLTYVAATFASDHDDGVTDVKEKNLNLTDLYVFREDNQTARSGHKDNLILIMNSNPRAIGGQQEYFNPKGYYDFHISRVGKDSKNVAPKGADDIVIRFEFSEADADQRQMITVTAFRDGQALATMVKDSDGKLLTTSMNDAKAGNYKANVFSVDGHEFKLFAGLREDPFFFDVEQFFRVRAGAAGLGPKVAFRPMSQAVDFTVGFNVNSIVLRLPIEFLQTSANEPIFDVWETISLK